MSRTRANDSYLNILLPILVVVKLLWVFFTISHFIAKMNKSQYEPTIKIIEEIHHIIYNILMGILLIYLYNTFITEEIVCISGRTKDYLFMFGILMIIGNFQKSFHMYYFTEVNNEA